MPGCKKCGYQNREENEYCVNCGAEIQLTPVEIEAKTRMKSKRTFIGAGYFVGGFFLLSGFTTIWGAMSYHSMIQGTILYDAFTRQLYSNQIMWGTLELLIGIVFLGGSYSYHHGLTKKEEEEKKTNDKRTLHFQYDKMTESHGA